MGLDIPRNDISADLNKASKKLGDKTLKIKPK